MFYHRLLRRALERTQSRIELAEAEVALAVGRSPREIRLDDLADTYARRHSLVDVCVEAPGDPAEECRAVRGPLLDRRQLEGQAEHRGDDPQPQPAARAAAGNAGAGVGHAQPPEQLERIAEAV